MDRLQHELGRQELIVEKLYYVKKEDLPKYLKKYELRMIVLGCQKFVFITYYLTS